LDSPHACHFAQLSTSFINTPIKDRSDKLFKPVTKWGFRVSGRNTAGLIERQWHLHHSSAHRHEPEDIAKEEEHEFRRKPEGKEGWGQRELGKNG
jgi:hypothetical protein